MTAHRERLTISAHPELLRYGDVKADGWADVAVGEVCPYDGAERLCRRRLDRLWTVSMQ